MNRIQTVCGLLACLIAVGAAAQSAPAEHVVDGQAPTFTLRVPAEFTPVTPVGQGVTHTFVRGSGPSKIVLNLIPFATEFRSEPLGEDILEVPVEHRYKLFWQDKTVAVYEIAKQENGQDVVVINAAVPTAGNGLIVQLAGFREMHGEMTRLLPTLLSGLNAPKPEKKKGLLDPRNATLLVILGMLIIIITLRRHQVMRKRQEQADESRRRAAWGDKPPE